MSDPLVFTRETVLRRKAEARAERARRFSFAEKLEIVERLRERVRPFVQNRKARSAHTASD
ncbi:MAG: hypothetical protein NBV67_04480 [Tagaea sp.]|nr:hypothetical protein [Tagaea sp.]